MSDIQALERDIENAKAVVAQRDMALKLSENREFRKLIIEGFLRDEAARYVHISTDPSLSAQDRADALASAQAAGHLKRWLNAIIRMGDAAASGLVEAEQALDEMRAAEA